MKKLKGIIGVTNLLNQESFTKKTQFISEIQAIKTAEYISRMNPDSIVTVSSAEGMFFHTLTPVNMRKDVTLVNEGKLDFIDYLEKWAGISLMKREDKQPTPKRTRKLKPKRISDSDFSCQASF